MDRTHRHRTLQHTSATAQTKAGGINFQNYAHFTGYGTDSWFPYTNGWNYLRGNLQFNGVLYDENNNGYYLDPNNTNRMNYVVADNLYVYGTVRGGSYGFGGMYVDVDGYCTGINGRVLNPFTGWCSCPAGFTSALLNVNQGNNLIYYCYK
ncbi:MAG: hypothetical protein UY97_C0003G0060 [Parcubacteria group bacterium GW2011_GWB1_57_6]|nr:MAG: hypothetical protein UY97_C0003G0060 [Parcubacteria group bacterium GW2011_GWB1_57_6]